MVLWIYEETSHTPLGIVDAFSDLAIFWRYDTPGEMAVELQLASELLIKPGMLIRPNHGAKTLGNEAFVVVNTEIREEETGNIMAVTARACSALLGRRCLYTAQHYEGTGGAIIKRMLDSVFSDARRGFAHFSYEIDESLGDKISYETQPMVLLDAIVNVCKASGLGFSCAFDPLARDMVFRLRYGVDHTAGVPGVTPVIFESAYQNISRVAYTDGVTNYATTAYVLGETNSSTDTRKWIEHDPNGATGYGRYEVVLESGKSSTTDQKNAEGENIKLTPAQYEKLLRDYGTEQLALRTRTNVAEGELMPDSGLVTFGADYNLGDIVTVRSKKWGASVTSRICEVAESYKDGMREVHLTVGDRAPIILEKMKRL